MKMNTGNQFKCLALICAILLSISASAQPFIRYVVPSDLGTKSVFSDAVLTSVTLPQGVSNVDNNKMVREAAFELMDIMRNKDLKLLGVYICGSASPDGLWQYNVNLSKARTEAAAKYIQHVTGIPSQLVHKESLNEDWNRLYELVEASDIPCKAEVLDIIRTKDWGDRKLALQRLDYGRVWRILLDDFFPQLRCVRIGFLCLWDPSKPYMTCPQPEKPAAPAAAAKTDTVYVRDTVYYMKETVYVQQQPDSDKAYKEYREENRKETRSRREAKIYDTPWMMGFKTNIVSDAMLIPDFGVEFQIAKNMSLNVNGWYSRTNVFCRNENTNIYGFSPELRWWFGDRPMQKGHFLGLHGNLAWYTLEWEKKDGTHVLYQNGKPNDYSKVNPGGNSPSWSVGLDYGYSLGFGRKANWGLEFVLGLGYINKQQNLGSWMETPEPAWYFTGNEHEGYFGVTKVGINLTYRFSLRRVNPDYYER